MNVLGASIVHVHVSKWTRIEALKRVLVTAEMVCGWSDHPPHVSLNVRS